MKKKSLNILQSLTFAVFLASLWSMSACERLDRLTQFHFSFSDTIAIPSMAGINLPFNIGTPPIRTNSSDAFAINDTRKDLIEELKIDTLMLIIVDPEDADFSFLKSIEVYIETDSLPEILVAWKYEIENSIGKTLILETTPDDLTEYIISDEIQFRISTVTDKIVTKDVEIEIQAGFFVNAKILGI